MNIPRSVVKMFLSRSGNSLLFFLAIFFFARWLDPSQLGVFFLFFALSGMLGIVANVGINGALEKRLSEGLDPEQMLGSSLAFKAVMVTLVSFCLLLGRPYINDYVGAQIAMPLIVYIVVKEFSRFYLGAVRGELRVGETAAIEFARRIVWIAVSIVLLDVGLGARGLILAAICGRAVEFAWAFTKCNTAVGRPSLAALRSLFAFSKYDTILSVGGRVYQWMDVLVVGFFLTQAHVGAYEMAWRVSLLVLLASKPIELTLFPQISEWDAQSSLDQIGNAVSKALRYTLFVSVPALAGASIYAADILRYLFGPDYVFAWLVLVVLMVEKVAQSVNDIIGSTVRAIDRPDLAAFATVLSIAVNLLLSPILVLSIGFVGAAIATTIAWFLNTLLHARYLDRFVSYRIPYELLGWYVFASVVMSGTLVAFTQILPVTSLPLLILHVGLGMVTYLATLFVIPNVRNEIISPGVRMLVS